MESGIYSRGGVAKGDVSARDDQCEDRNRHAHPEEADEANGLTGIQFGNIVPTGLEKRGNKIYMAEAGPVPHDPADGKVVSFKVKSPSPAGVASGAPLLVDVEFGRGRDLYALSQGSFGGGPPGSPAAPNTGSLVKVKANGTFSGVGDTLDRPTSVEFIKNTAYVVTLTGEIWKIKNASGPPHGTH